MTSLDYTELFVKGGSGNIAQKSSQQLTIDDIYRDDDPAEEEGGDSSNERNLITFKPNENVDSLVAIEDQSIWVSNQIEALGFTSPNNDFSPELIQIFSSLFRERDHWQLQSQNLAYSCSSLKTKIDSLERNKEIDSNRILALNQDLHTANEQISALKGEQRDLKNAWLSNKGELETRCFQLQALQTQIQGTLRKKEKDYDRLQAQFTKLTKDTQKQQKGQSSTPSIVISQPLQRPSSQSLNKPGTLLDAEITSAKTTIATLEMENQNLRNSIQDLTITFEEFQSNMTRELLEKSQSLSALESKAMTASAMTCLEQAKYVESRIDATTALLTSVSSPLVDETISSANQSTSGERYGTPRRAYHKPSLLGTPTARPLDWIVKQANTEVKLLRKRAEDLQWYIPPAKSIDESGGDVEEMFMENKENNPVGNETQHSSGSGAYNNDLTQKYRTKLMNLKHQLEEAVNVICEQDRLIHAALVGNMSSYTTDRSNMNGLNYAEEDEGNGSDEELPFEDNDEVVTPMKRNQMNSSYDPSDWSAGFSELLPAVSPDTMAILKAANFTTLPSHIIDEDGNIEPRTLTSTLEELSET